MNDGVRLRSANDSDRPIPFINFDDTDYKDELVKPYQMAPLEPGLARGTVRELFRRYGKGAILDRVGMARTQIDATPFTGAAIDLNEFNNDPSNGTSSAERQAVLEGVAARAAAASGPLCNIRSIAPYGWRALPAGYSMEAEIDSYGNGIAAATARNEPCAKTPSSGEPTLEQIQKDHVPKIEIEE